MVRTIIQGGTIVSSDSTYQADLLIEGEQIAGILAHADPQPDDTVIDASGLLVLPGIIDAHTHIQLDTGIYQTADNWEIGTRAAAAGGVTTVIDFATQFPGQTADEALDNRLNETEPAIIDYGLHCMITDLPYGKEQALLGRLVERGVPSFKVYTTYRPNYYMDDAGLMRLMHATVEVNGLVMVHAENDAIVTEATNKLVAEGKTGWQYHAQARPVEAELEAINRALYLGRLTGVSLYFVHCTHYGSFSQIQQARSDWGLSFFCETCPQYLLLNDSVYNEEHPEHYILQPPLRHSDWPEGEQSRMWVGLMREIDTPRGAIDVIATDSCDYTLAQKTEHTEFTQTPGGLPGIETLLPLMYTYGVVEGIKDFDLPMLIDKLSAAPARIFGLYPRKGALTIGSDADVVLYDPETEGTISHKDLHYVADYNPYEGMRVKGKVRMTLSRGEIIYHDGEFPGKTGRGRFVPGKI